jgi:hypothetical protein
MGLSWRDTRHPLLRPILVATRMQVAITRI